MTNLDLRFDGPIPKYLRQTVIEMPVWMRDRTEEAYRIKQAQKNQYKKMFVYPSKNNPISQHEKNTETKGKSDG